jgi:3-hydroxyisobutyrate dehydrogenase-like beta-hydroxyacid dehydrogenase
MAASLLAAGHAVTVWNRDAARTAPLVAKGAVAAATPAKAVAGAEFAISMVRDIAASRAVWLDPETGALAGMGPAAIAIESSTISVAWARELASIFAKHKIAIIDAPVSGSRKQADARELIYLVGGEKAAVDVARPILLAMGKSVEYAGAAGCGIALKLMVNASMGVQVANLAELLASTEKLGIARAKAMEIFTSTAVCSPWVKANAAAILAREYAPQFTVGLVEKDLQYEVEAAASESAAVPVTQAAQQAYAKAVAAKLGDENLTAIAEIYGNG